MMKAVWKDTVLAESEETILLEGNHYFPPESLNRENFRASSKQTICPWKGKASYYDIVVEDDVNPAGAWYYPNPSRAAEQIEGHVAFWQGVRIIP
jgi:uncharacterized protein (DUF427 family)